MCVSGALTDLVGQLTDLVGQFSPFTDLVRQQFSQLIEN